MNTGMRVIKPRKIKIYLLKFNKRSSQSTHRTRFYIHIENSDVQSIFDVILKVRVTSVSFRIGRYITFINYRKNGKPYTVKCTISTVVNLK